MRATSEAVGAEGVEHPACRAERRSVGAPVVCGQDRGSGGGRPRAGRALEAVEGFPGRRGAPAGEGPAQPSGHRGPAFSTLRAV